METLSSVVCVDRARASDSSVPRVGQESVPNADGAAAVSVVPRGVCSAVLEISGMPREFRPRVEDAMVECVPSRSEFVIPGDDPLTAQWCTRWYRDVLRCDAFGEDAFGADELGEDALPADVLGVSGRTCGGGERVGVGCRQVLTGTPEELEALRERVAQLASQGGFRARVSVA